MFVYHLHMGGPDAAAVEWSALYAPRFEARIRHSNVEHVASAADADVVVVTGLLTPRNLDAVLAELAAMPSPSVLVAAGDSAISPSVLPDDELRNTDGPNTSAGNSPSSYRLSHYADVHISVPGNPPTPQALIAALAAASNLLAQPREALQRWSDQ